MGASQRRMSRRWARGGPAWVLALLAAALQGCALYRDLMQNGGSLPLGDRGAEWSPAVSTPAGGAVGVQIIHRF